VSNGKSGLGELHKTYPGSVFKWTDRGLLAFWFPKCGQVPRAILHEVDYLELLGPSGMVVKDRSGDRRKLSETEIPEYAAVVQIMES
jgi:hypothetical protein